MRRREESAVTFTEFVSEHGSLHIALSVLMVTKDPALIASMTPEEWEQAFRADQAHLHKGFRKALIAGMRTRDKEYVLACVSVLGLGPYWDHLETEDYRRLVRYVEEDPTTQTAQTLLDGYYRQAHSSEGCGDSLEENGWEYLLGVVGDKISSAETVADLLQVCSSGEWDCDSVHGSKFMYRYSWEVAEKAVRRAIDLCEEHDKKNPEDLTAIAVWKSILTVAGERLPGMTEELIDVLLKHPVQKLEGKLQLLDVCFNNHDGDGYLKVAGGVVTDLSVWTFEQLISQLHRSRGGAGSTIGAVSGIIYDEHDVQRPGVHAVQDALFEEALLRVNTIGDLERVRRTLFVGRTEAVGSAFAQERKVFDKMLRIGLRTYDPKLVVGIAASMCRHAQIEEETARQVLAIDGMADPRGALKTAVLCDHITCIHAKGVNALERRVWEQVLAEEKGFEEWFAIVSQQERSYLDPDLHKKLWECVLASAVEDEQKERILELIYPRQRSRYFRSRRSDGVEWEVISELLPWKISKMTDLKRVVSFMSRYPAGYSIHNAAKRRISELVGTPAS